MPSHPLPFTLSRGAGRAPDIPMNRDAQTPGAEADVARDPDSPGRDRAPRRIAWLDALRGFALLGILLANLPLLAGYPFISPALRDALPAAELAPVVALLSAVLVDAKFYALFSFLFGLGFALQLRRAQALGIDPARAHRRRMVALMGIGLAHACLLWWGDILWVYALLGLALLVFRSAPQRVLLAGALGFLAAPVLVYLAFLATGMPDPFAPRPGTPPDAGFLLKVTHAFPEGGYPDVVESNLMMTAGSAARRTLRFQLLRILGMFLLGAWVAGLDLQQRMGALRPMFRRWLVLGFALGLPLNLAYFALGGGDSLLPATASGLLAVLVASAGIPLLAIAYVAVFALHWQRDDARSLLIAGGRTALSLYVMQSMIGVALFYGLGLGLWGRLGRLDLLLLALLIWPAQLWLARAWLRLHARGPLESLWRRLARVAARASPRATA
jgi:uncharacterized protein